MPETELRQTAVHHPEQRAQWTATQPQRARIHNSRRPDTVLARDGKQMNSGLTNSQCGGLAGMAPTDPRV